MKFRRERRGEGDLRIDFTNLVDVLLILLIFFMVSTTLNKDARLGITLPQAENADASQPPPQYLTIAVNDQGAYAVNGEALVNDRPEILELAIQKATDGKSDQPVVLQGDAKAPHEAVVRALDILGKLGFSQVSIAARTTDPGTGK